MRIPPGPVLAGLAWGVLVGATPFFSPIGLAAQLLFGAGLCLTYGSIGLLVAILPRPRFNLPRPIFGLLVGAAYSLPGSLFTAVPAPLRDDAPAYYRNFAAGGPKEALMTLVFGLLAGLCAGLALPRPAGASAP
jgi:hypothetical protein